MYNMYRCDKSNCIHNIDTKEGQCCSIPYDNTVHNCNYEVQEKVEENETK